MDNRLCPFCNSEPEIKEETTILRTNKESTAQNIKLVEVVHGRKTDKIVGYRYEQTHYIVRCSNKECIAYQMKKKFWSSKIAYEIWNKRRES